MDYIWVIIVKIESYAKKCKKKQPLKKSVADYRKFKKHIDKAMTSLVKWKRWWPLNSQRITPLHPPKIPASKNQTKVANYIKDQWNYWPLFNLDPSNNMRSNDSQIRDW